MRVLVRNPYNIYNKLINSPFNSETSSLLLPLPTAVPFARNFTAAPGTEFKL